MQLSQFTRITFAMHTWCNGVKCYSSFKSTFKAMMNFNTIYMNDKCSRNTLFQQQHLYSTNIKTENSTFTQSGRGVYISTCQNIYHNLAFEDWIYTNGNFNNGELLFLWRNQPCVVVGRHQNVWAECHVLGALGEGVDIARRRSGGGTVYHDLGNLNCTFFTSRTNYNRKQNLELVAQALRKGWKLGVNLSKRDDLMLDDKFKISGTAAKLGRNTAYHHCTVLFDVQVDQLHTLLNTPMEGLESRATDSVRSVVKNLREVDSTINYTTLLDSISSQYLSDHHKHHVTYIDPTQEEKFPGIGKLGDELRTWDWIYGHSPAFSISHSASGPLDGGTVQLSMRVAIKKGHIESARLQLTECSDSHNELLAVVCDTLTGCRFWPMHITIALLSIRLHIRSPELWALINACFSGFLEPDSSSESQRNSLSS